MKTYKCVICKNQVDPLDENIKSTRSGMLLCSPQCIEALQKICAKEKDEDKDEITNSIVNPNNVILMAYDPKNTMR